MTQFTRSSWVQGPAIVMLAIALSILYGIVHDQVTARICVEYFTVGHPRVIASTDPTLLGLVWGVLATWWVGAILGSALAFVARVGSRPKRTARSLLRPLGLLLVSNGLFAFLAGVVGYFAAARGYVWLTGSLAERVPQEKHVAFLVDLWAHSASYLGGFVGSIVIMIWVWRARGRSQNENRMLSQEPKREAPA